MKSKRSWPGRTEQVEHQVAVDRDPAEVHRHRRLGLARRSVGDALLGRQHGDLADRADQRRLAGRERAGDDDLDGLAAAAAGAGGRHHSPLTPAMSRSMQAPVDARVPLDHELAGSGAAAVAPTTRPRWPRSGLDRDGAQSGEGVGAPSSSKSACRLGRNGSGRGGTTSSARARRRAASGRRRRTRWPATVAVAGVVGSSAPAISCSGASDDRRCRRVGWPPRRLGRRRPRRRPSSSVVATAPRPAPDRDERLAFQRGEQRLTADDDGDVVVRLAVLTLAGRPRAGRAGPARPAWRRRRTGRCRSGRPGRSRCGGRRRGRAATTPRG